MSLSQAFLPGTPLEPAVIPTAHASSFTLQYFIIIIIILYIRSFRLYWRPVLHPQPQDATCRLDRDPRIAELWALCAV